MFAFLLLASDFICSFCSSLICKVSLLEIFCFFFCHLNILFYFVNVFNWLCYYNCSIFFSSLFPYALYPPPTSSPYLSSCPWVIHISSLAFTFPILFLTASCLFRTYHLCLFPVPFPTFFPFSLPTDNAPCDFHFCDSVPFVVVCLVCFCFWF